MFRDTFNLQHSGSQPFFIAYLPYLTFRTVGAYHLIPEKNLVAFSFIQ